MNNSIKTTTASLMLAGAAFGGVCAASDCKTVNQESAVANLVAQHGGSKVLKVEETIDANGCVELQVRILIDGTVKVLVVPNTTGA